MAKKLDEKALAAANYIVNFYQEVLNVKNLFCQYMNVILELKSKVNNIKNIKGFEPEDLKTLQVSVQNMRIAYVQVYISYESIKRSIEQKDTENDNKINKLYEELKKDYIIDVDKLQEYVMQINIFLLTGVVKDLLQTSNTLVSEIYKE